MTPQRGDDLVRQHLGQHPADDLCVLSRAPDAGSLVASDSRDEAGEVEVGKMGRRFEDFSQAGR